MTWLWLPTYHNHPPTGKLYIGNTPAVIDKNWTKFIHLFLGSSSVDETIKRYLKGLCTKKFYWLKSCTLPPLSRGHRWKIWQITIKNRKLHFCEIFGLSKLLTGQENGSQKGITEQKQDWIALGSKPIDLFAVVVPIS